MKVAVISFDVRYVENLKDSVKNVEMIAYGDTISFLKDFETIKPDLIIYDTTSGIFAEDDLRYLLSKGIVEDGRIVGLTSPENPIDLASFQDKVAFFDKTHQTNELLSFITNLKEKVQEKITPQKLSKEEVELSKAHKVEPKEEFDIDYTDIFDFQNIENILKIESPAEIEYTSIEPIFEEGINKTENKPQVEETKIFKIEHLPQIEHTSMEHIFEETTPSLEVEPKVEKRKETVKVENLPKIEDTSVELESLRELLTPKVESPKEEYPIRQDKVIEQTQKEVIKETPKPKTNFFKFKEYFEEKKAQEVVSSHPEEAKKGGESMIANFNIQISDEELKGLALQIARNFLEKDPVMEKIVDHLQIDFQEETRKELDKLKDELKEQLKREAEKKMTLEIERLIKEELKDFVAEITARIVREKIEQVFKAF